MKPFCKQLLKIQEIYTIAPLNGMAGHFLSVFVASSGVAKEHKDESIITAMAHSLQVEN